MTPHNIKSSVNRTNPNASSFAVYLSVLVGNFGCKLRNKVGFKANRTNMLAIIIGFIVLLAGRLRMTPHYGLKGAGARIAGLLIFAYGLMLTLYGSKEGKVPSVTVLGVAVTGVTILVQCFVAWIITVIMIAIFGNGYEEKPLPDSFSRKAALFSILATLSCGIVGTIVLLTDVVARPFGGPHPMVYLVFGGVSFIIIPLGFILAIVALFGIRKHGTRGILGWAILGIIINGSFIASTIMRVQYGREFTDWVKIGTTTASTRQHAHAPGTPTDAECEEFGRQLEIHFAEGDYKFYVNAIDFDSLLDRFFPGSGMKLDLKIVEGAKKGYYTTINDQTLKVKSMKFLRLKQLDGEKGILLRQLNKDDGLDYRVFILKYNRNGDLKIVDAFYYTLGEKLSELLKPTLIPFLQEQDKTLAGRLFTNSGSCHVSTSMGPNGNIELAGKIQGSHGHL